jgi:hypothetical protein
LRLKFNLIGEYPGWRIDGKGEFELLNF